MYKLKYVPSHRLRTAIVLSGEEGVDYEYSIFGELIIYDAKKWVDHYSPDTGNSEEYKRIKELITKQGRNNP
jgi:hypothetical protein